MRAFSQSEAGAGDETGLAVEVGAEVVLMPMQEVHAEAHAAY